MAAHESKGFCHYSSVWNVLSKNDEDPRLLEHRSICLWSPVGTSVVYKKTDINIYNIFCNTITRSFSADTVSYDILSTI